MASILYLIAWRQARTDSGVVGRTPTHDLREIFNAILYLNRTGGRPPLQRPLWTRRA